MSTNKNAYEIRADILREAVGILQGQYEREMNIWEQTRTRDPQTSKIIDANDGSMPKPIKTKDILDCANELYSFVDSK